jgi:hypothetical protein
MGGRRDCFNGEWGTTFRARKWRSLDPCGLACVSLSAGIHLFAVATIASNFLRHSSVGVALFVVIYFPSTLMALWSLYMAWSSDPGAVPMVRFFTFVVVTVLLLMWRGCRLKKFFVSLLSIHKGGQTPLSPKVCS